MAADLHPLGSSADLHWSARALELAAKADFRTSPNPMVGAVVLDKDGRVAGEGFEDIHFTREFGRVAKAAIRMQHNRVVRFERAGGGFPLVQKGQFGALFITAGKPNIKRMRFSIAFPSGWDDQSERLN